jgi:hypothetical protein
VRQVKMIRRAFLRIIFLIAPAILLSGYAVYWTNDFLAADGVHIPTLLYQAILLAVLWIAMWLTAKPLIDDLRKRARERKTEQRDEARKQ